ncbi:winged helix-turn-helix transcriptional regulator [Desulfofundulus sp. TPOSR]|jgi:ArsR family transcriptional regulator|uniref:ArsR/SmtB family transcription factor n=1 Tax=Desulfofundulus sp. TPOSR TaxID=2714340 RepID=UPI00140989C3|nr:metalloregulator ArsR/SmtB family transcription factor [Desulfofundulus sp. TPOSR]NHM27563.1 winged helix-turn-helix transcriptional regulator [Desulfofundulus sp. TPOSR]
MNKVQQYEEKAELLKALAHPIRLCIVDGLINNECNVTRMRECLDLPQSTVSQHLGILKSRGIIRGRRQGTEICYTVTNELVKDLMKVLMNVRAHNQSLERKD